MGARMTDSGETWPSLPLNDWQETYTTLHRWMQIVGKIRLALAPMTNHWWQVTLYVTARGLTSSPIPYGTRSFQIDFDFLAHRRVPDTDSVHHSRPAVCRHAGGGEGTQS